MLSHVKRILCTNTLNNEILCSLSVFLICIKKPLILSPGQHGYVWLSFFFVSGISWTTYETLNQGFGKLNAYVELVAHDFDDGGFFDIAYSHDSNPPGSVGYFKNDNGTFGANEVIDGRTAAWIDVGVVFGMHAVLLSRPLRYLTRRDISSPWEETLLGHVGLVGGTESHITDFQEKNTAITLQNFQHSSSAQMTDPTKFGNTVYNIMDNLNVGSVRSATRMLSRTRGKKLQGGCEGGVFSNLIQQDARFLLFGSGRTMVAARAN